MKSQLRLAAQTEIGIKLDDKLEHAQKELWQIEGARQGLGEAMRKIEQLNAVVDQWATEENVNELVSKGGLAVVAEIKKWVARSANTCHALQDMAAQQTKVTQGRVEGLSAAISICKTLVDQERAKLDRGVDPEEVRNAVLSASQELMARKAEAQAEKAANGTNA